MRRFNPEKELRKIQKGNKNKIVISVLALLLIIAIGSSYALYQIRYNKQIIYTTVAPFYSKDLQLAVYVNGVKQDEFPEQSPDMLYGGYECERDSKVTFNRDKWNITLETNHPDKCNLKFGTKYEDKSGANYPEIYQGMIPVYFKEGKIYIADVTSKWYDYNEHEWANAVLIDYENKKDKFYDENNNLLGGHEVSENDILQMYVWIPRYKYQLFNVEGNKIDPQMINITFESGTNSTGDVKCTYTNEGNGTITESCTNKETSEPAKNEEWYTHPAFTFKGTTETEGTELKGVWVGKFETSGTRNGDDTVSDLKIVPSVSSLRPLRLGNMFRGVRNMEETYSETYNINTQEIDTHIMKNTEWGVVAYLTQSKYGRFNQDGREIASGAEVWINNAINYITGCAGSSVSAKRETCTDDFKWSKGGVHASTTDNMYGIYDMSGGASDYVMGNMVNQQGEFNSFEAYFSITPDSKYYDIYTYGEDVQDIKKGHLGDATKETSGWNGDTQVPPRLSWPWIIRGIHFDAIDKTGLWAYGAFNGFGYDYYYTFRIVIVKDY